MRAHHWDIVVRLLSVVFLFAGCTTSSEAPAAGDAAPETTAIDTSTLEETAVGDSLVPDTSSADTLAPDTSTDASSADAMDASGIHYNPTVFALFAKNCATTGCHVGSAPAGTLGLGEAKPGYDALMSTSKEMPTKQLVVPFDPSSSFLMSKLDHPVAVLTVAEKKLVQDWIASGALY